MQFLPSASAPPLFPPVWQTATLPALRRLLADWGQTVPEEAAGAGGDATSQLADRLDWTAAIALSRALVDVPAHVPGDARAAVDWACAALARLQAELRAGFEDAERAQDDAAGLRLHHQQQQRLMAGRVASMRERLRARMAALSPPLQQLAALDAVLETALAERERNLLTALPALHADWLARLQAAAAADPDPASWRPRAWAELQRALRLELDLRLQPVMGLLEALQHDLARS